MTGYPDIDVIREALPTTTPNSNCQSNGVRGRGWLRVGWLSERQYLNECLACTIKLSKKRARDMSPAQFESDGLFSEAVIVTLGEFGRALLRPWLQCPDQ
jgi:hypothetical protein